MPERVEMPQWQHFSVSRYWAVIAMAPRPGFLCSQQFSQVACVQLYLTPSMIMWRFYSSFHMRSSSDGLHLDSAAQLLKKF